MFLEESPEQKALRAELRQYYADLLTDEVRGGLAAGGEGGEAWSQVVRQIGKDGWLGIGWPTEFGGQGRPATDQFIFFDETRRAGAPFPFVTINTVGPTIMRFGTEEQKSFFLPQILAGELNFAIGYTEPEAGTDLASLRTRAVRDGDEYVSTGPRSSPAAPTRPTTSGSPAAPIRTFPSTRASPFCACRRPRPASSGRSSTPWAG